jgi:hypothetical protein
MSRTMMYMVGLELLTRREKASLLAQMKSITAGIVLREGARSVGGKVAQAGKRLVGRLTGDGAMASAPPSTAVRSEVAARMQLEEWRLRSIPESSFDREYRAQLCRVAAAKAGDAEDVVSGRILHRAARALGIRVAVYADDASLESAVMEKGVARLIDRLTEHLKFATPEEEVKLERILNEELSRMGATESETLRQALGLEKLTGRALTALFRTVSGTVIVQALFSAAGFGAYLFVTIALKAFSALVGIVFPFVVYTSATTALAALLSPMAVPAVAVASAGVVAGTLESRISDEFAVVLVMVGQAALAERSQMRPV